MNTQFASRRDSMSAMFDPNCFFQNSLADLKADGRYRTFLSWNAGRERSRSPIPWPDPVVVWCSNDYLGMGQHPVVLAAMHEAVDRVGTGLAEPAISQATPVITSCSSANLRICTARSQPSSSLPAM